MVCTCTGMPVIMQNDSPTVTPPGQIRNCIYIRIYCS